MSFFKDDFYSTKTSKRELNNFNRRPKRGDSRMGIALFSAVGGALIVLLVFGFIGFGHTAGKPAQNVISTITTGKITDTDETRVVQAGEKMRPAVVSVVSLVKSADPTKDKGYGLGSGVIFQISGDKARIVTNNHVVEGGSSYEIVLSDKQRRKAVLVGRDSLTDLAVLEIDSTGIKVSAEFGDSDSLKSGQTAIAIGNPLGMDFAQTVTKGIISSPKRTIPTSVGKDGNVVWEMDVIQTDAAINQGNSGGPLVNLDGQVIGINSLKIAESGVEGLGFAIPINEAKPILDLLIRDHKVKRAYMGITPDDLATYTSGLDILKLPDNVKSGVIVVDTTGPAKEAGLKTRDVIVELDGHAIANGFELRKYLFAEKKIGDTLEVTYYRSGKKAVLTLTLGELPDQ
ncbi:MAG: serine protease [Bacilli bacterium]|nr:serine protease [Bacilli bacterium]